VSWPLPTGKNLYTLDDYLKLVEQIIDAGADVLAIKRMAGLLCPASAHTRPGDGPP
jgi:pyruvate carboxylase